MVAETCQHDPLALQKLREKELLKSDQDKKDYVATSTLPEDTELVPANNRSIQTALDPA